MAREFPNPKSDPSSSRCLSFSLSSPATDSRNDVMKDYRFDEQGLKKAQRGFARLVCKIHVSPKSFCDENIHFRGFIDTLNPTFKCSFRSLEHNCLKVFAQEREKIKRTFSEFGGRISLSVDILLYEKKRWEPLDWYMCLCAHFIDDDWKLRKWVIKYCGVYDDIEEHPITDILKSLEEWGINSKISTITIGENEMATLAVDEIQEGIQERGDLPLNGQLFHVQCCSDVITRIVEEGFKEISEIISKVRLLAWSKSDPLWYLTNSKLKHALKLDAMGEFSSESENEVPSEEEWGKVRSMCRIADRIYEIVKELFDIKRPTSNLFLPHLLEIHTFLTQESASSNAFESTVARKMLKIFDDYLKDMYLVLSIAAFMDPRHKMEFISFSSSKLEVGDGESKSTFVLETIRKLYEGYTEVQNNENEYFSSESSCESEFESEFESEEEEGSGRRARKHECNLVEGLSIFKEYRDSVQPMIDEPKKSDLDIYLEEPILPHTENFNVLVWWKDNRSKYPRLSRMAREFLAIPISVGTSYGAYSIEPREADYTVVSLKPELMNALMCVRSWNLRLRNN